MRGFDRDLIRGGHYGQRSCEPKRGYDRDLKPELLAAPRGCEGQRRNLVEGKRELLDSFNQGRTLQGPLPSLAPQACGLLDQPGFSVVTRQQLRLGLGDLRETRFKRFGDPGVKRASWLAQQRAIGRILHQSVFEQVIRVWRDALGGP